MTLGIYSDFISHTEHGNTGNYLTVMFFDLGELKTLYFRWVNFWVNAILSLTFISYRIRESKNVFVLF